jgi:2,4-dienoyl-CoA reductase (NADPH2)
VTLYEQSRYLGGAVALASMVKGFDIEELPKFLDFFRTQVKKTGVKVKLHKQFDDAALAEEKPDVLIVAAGGIPTKPDVPGYELKNVVKTADLYDLLKQLIWIFGPQMLRKLTKLYMPVGKKVVVIGGAIQGFQLSEFLIKRGRDVTIVDEGETLGEWLVPERKTRLFYWLDKKGIVRLTGVKLVKITKEGLTIQTKEGQTRLLEADTIIPVLPFSPNKELAEKAKGKVAEIYTIGDCDSPAVIPDSTKAGWQLGNSL